MSATAQALFAQVIRLIPHLADEHDHDIADIARELDISPAELLHALTAIAERYDVPAGFVEGFNIFIENASVSVRTNHLKRPMRLTMPELCAMELGLLMVRRERVPSEQKPVDRALARLRDAISKVPVNDQYEGIRHAELAVQGSVDHLATLRAAHQDHRKVSLRYRSGGATESSGRVICPHALVYAEQMWYVIALCDDTVVRFFRLDRIEHVEILDETFEPDTQVLDDVMSRHRAFASETERRMVVRYSPAVARWIAEREGLTLAADGSMEVEYPLADDSWAIRHVLQYGPEAEILSPPELRALIAERLLALGGNATALPLS